MKKIIPGVLVLLLAATIFACKKDTLTIKFVEINSDDLARFQVHNANERDVISFETEISYLTEDKEPVRTDTVTFNTQATNGTIVPAGESTFVVQQVPPRTKSAAARILNYSFKR